ncbi:MAG: tetratricopeptide repeat protein [Aurantibacter sp.]
MNRSVGLGCLICLLLACKEERSVNATNTSKSTEIPDAISLFGDSLFSPEPTEKLQGRFKEHENNYLKDSTKVENLIWYGRFVAYKGDYLDAIAIFSNGMLQYPDDARLYRHRGHRYITIRQFDDAIKDYGRAVQLIQGKPNEIEPDGMPNARNIPISTLHGNIYYHLGLAHYLNWDLEKALDAYKNCLSTGGKPDNLVSATHWIYMILQLLNRKEEAKKYLEPIHKEMDIIENMAYHELCLFYKGEMGLEELEKNFSETPGSDGIKYGIANWHFYNGEKEMAKKKLKQLVNQKSWNSFGYIAAESQLKKYFQ